MDRQCDSGPEIKKERILSIDITKGIGFFLVVLGHLVPSNTELSVVIFSFHMPLFYIMSGYTMPLDITRKNFSKRMISLIFNYFFFCYIGFLVSMIIPAWRAGLASSTLFFDVIYNTQPECIHVGQLWFLFSMIWSTLFFFGIHFIFPKRETACIIATVLVAALSVIFSIHDMQITNRGSIYGSLPFKILPGMSALLFLEIGYLLKKLKLVEKLEALKLIDKIILAVFLLAGVSYTALRNVRVNIALGIYGSIPLYYLTSIGGTLGVLVLSSAIKGRIGKAIGFYGKNSLAFFSIHSMFLYLYAKVLSMIYHTNMMIMQNINIPLSILGTILILLFIIPMKVAYDQTGGKLLRLINKEK